MEKDRKGITLYDDRAKRYLKIKQNLQNERKNPDIKDKTVMDILMDAYESEE